MTIKASFDLHFYALFQYYGPRPRPRPPIDGYHTINMYRTRSHPRRFRHKVTTTGIDVNLPFARLNRGRGLADGTTAVFPGTNWCGYGTTTMDQQMDLGVFHMTDFCCKIHDKCPFFIRPGQKRYHLVNNGLYTRSHCKCDRDFYRCLKRANTIISNKIGRTYFNVLGPQCFQEAAPVVGCNQHFGNRCRSYAFDRAFPGRIVQWFDNPMF